ncbi:HCLS1-associated protein X-1 [Operophtera brumata]|uniref:HCLS1-associated protein X-1 n=1 Tax=Operophtera brumata TaxID=104452 RepID=A0A0L7LEE0_OPEBR|nr:HCLS1-associated protein X-1 [Operophtera brumata]
MENNTFMDKIRTFFGIRQEAPRNDFRNPIWGSDDEDDDDELYTRQQIDVYTDPTELHDEFASQMQVMLKSFGSIFGDMKSFFRDDHFDSIGTSTEDDALGLENFQGNSIRDYYLKPGHTTKQQPKEDIDLDGKISSHEISGLLKRKEDSQNSKHQPFNGNMVPGRSFCQTIITTSVKKSDGTVETRRIVKNGHEVIEETTTSVIDNQPSFSTNVDPQFGSGIIYSNVISELSSLFKNFY